MLTYLLYTVESRLIGTYIIAAIQHQMYYASFRDLRVTYPL